MSDLVSLIAEVLREHRLTFLDQWICGQCRQTFANIREADAHVAEVVADRLNEAEMLTRCNQTAGMCQCHQPLGHEGDHTCGVSGKSCRTTWEQR